ncbi:hypothetical protein LTR85_008315 [Meristemomyces frigidus]|nr:hypothetical protein LTR85_008315 [Meristemomyces frigidus]
MSMKKIHLPIRFGEPLKPEDGTAPFYQYFMDDVELYDSDDEYMSTVDGDEWDTSGNQLVPPSSALSSDRRFIWMDYSLEPKTALGLRGFAVNGADTLISLSPAEEDTLFLPSRLLRQSHPMFEAASVEDGSRASSTPERMSWRVDTPSPTDTSLSSTRMPKLCSSVNGRQHHSNERKDRHLDFLEDHQNAISPVFDEASLAHDLASLRFDRLAHHEIWIAAHKVGFALLCGFPAKLYRRSLERRQNRKTAEKALLVLRLIEWIHAYGPLNALAVQLERSILGPYVGMVVCHRYPHTFLRIAVLLESEQLFRSTFSQAVSMYAMKISHGYLTTTTLAHARLSQELGGDSLLERHVVLMHGALAVRMTRLYARLLDLQDESHPQAPTSRLATTIWLDWYARNMADACIPKSRIIHALTNATLSPEGLIEEYRQHSFRNKD